MDFRELFATPDRWALWITGPILLWILISGLDDLFIYFILFLSQFQKKKVVPKASDLREKLEQRIAIFVPLWKEHQVVRQMVEHNIASILYENYDVFLGGYPNDPATIDEIGQVASRFVNVHLAQVPHDGPTSKADCLNWVFQTMLEFEEVNETHFDLVIVHDAEDLIHPEGLRWINWYGGKYDMVQIPVLALETPPMEFTHGIYCDEFVEFQMRDLRVREILRGFLPSSGVGTGFSRWALETLAERDSNRVFEPSCLTEDYENGFRIHKAGGRETFLPIEFRQGVPIATREYFPRTFRAALKQRTRWVTGIALQGWQRHGWSGGPRQWYWHWRDRKGLVGNPLSVVANLLFLYFVARAVCGVNLAGQTDWWIRVFSSFAVALNLLQITTKMVLVKRIYGWKHVLILPLRIPFANLVNALATFAAIYTFTQSRLANSPLQWLKTEHIYPDRASLLGKHPRLGQVLVQSNYITYDDLTSALDSQPAGVRIGEHLVKMGLIEEESIYEALSLQQSIPLTHVAPAEVSRRVARCLPGAMLKHFKVVPYKIEAGNLFLAGPDIPVSGMAASLKRFTRLEIRFHFVTATNYSELTHTLLAPAAQ